MMKFENVWGSTGSGVDQQRSDLFKVQVSLPPQVAGGGANVWDSEIGWAIEKFPFPDRAVEAIPIKYLQQTNFQIGGDVASEPVVMVARYAFQRRTAMLLEQWRQLIANPQTGAVGLTSLVKSSGTFYWLVPNPLNTGSEVGVDPDAYIINQAYILEGCWIKGLKPSEQDMTSGTGLVTYDISMQIDRYYPIVVSDLQVSIGPNGTVTGAGVVLNTN